MPKLAVLVNMLLTNPDQYLEILPIVDISFKDFTWRKEKKTSIEITVFGKLQLCIPEIFK